MNLDAYVIPTDFHDKPDNFRTGSPYQQLVDPHTVQKHQEQTENSRLKISGKHSSPKVICHITNWSFYRKGEGKFVPENLDSKLCTHIIYSFATLEPDVLELREFDPWGDIENQLYDRTVNLDKNVPVLLGMGGWTDSSGDKYSRLVSDPRRRSNFINRAISFLRQYGFSGAHIDWNYPSCPQSDCRVGPARDREDFTKFIQVRQHLIFRQKQLNFHFFQSGTSQSFRPLRAHVEYFNFWLQRNHCKILRLERTFTSC